MNFGFSYIGLVYLLMLFIPNLFWTKNRPKNYDEYVKNENKILRIFENIGQVLVTCIVLIFKDFNIKTDTLWVIWLVISFALMVLYEIFWIRYFKSEKTMRDFYSSLFGIPVAGATLPVIAFLILGIYGRNILLVIAAIILGIGHIGIHINYKKALS